MELRRFGQILAVAVFFHSAIVATGAAVRLTTSGLGCVDWPGCSESAFVPEWSFHAWVEYGNRLFSFPVIVASVVALWATYKLSNRSRLATALAWWLVIGTLIQALVGAVVVRQVLSPVWVSFHFLGSMTILASAVTLWFVAGRDNGAWQLDSSCLWPALPSIVAATVVLVTGTVVTGTGPHSGDADAPRWGFELASVVRVHSIAAWVLCGTVVYLAFRQPRLHSTTRWLAIAVLAQGAIGYWQYFNGVPALAVFSHIIGAVVVWLTTFWLGGRAASTAPLPVNAPRLAAQVSP